MVQRPATTETLARARAHLVHGQVARVAEEDGVGVLAVAVQADAAHGIVVVRQLIHLAGLVRELKRFLLNPVHDGLKLGLRKQQWLSAIHLTATSGDTDRRDGRQAGGGAHAINALQPCIVLVVLQRWECSGDLSLRPSACNAAEWTAAPSKPCRIRWRSSGQGQSACSRARRERMAGSVRDWPSPAL
jgi:hypothetical protein